MAVVFKSPMQYEEKKGLFVFLAGPMSGAPYWQSSVPKIAEKMGITDITWLSPRKTMRHVPSKTQIDWETRGLRLCDLILFWIPNQVKETKGKDYAQTTRMELAENLARGKKIILGIDTDIRGTRHMKYMADRYGISQVHTSLEGCLEELKLWVEQCEKAEAKTHYLLNPGFDCQETLAEKPQFVDMDAMNLTIAEKWNQRIGIHDKVYVYGNFGNPSWMKLLNGDIQLINEGAIKSEMNKFESLV